MGQKTSFVHVGYFGQCFVHLLPRAATREYSRRIDYLNSNASPTLISFSSTSLCISNGSGGIMVPTAIVQILCEGNSQLGKLRIISISQCLFLVEEE